MNNPIAATQQKQPLNKKTLVTESALYSTPSNLIAGCVMGILAVFIQASLAALIFSGEMNKYFGAGLSILLLGTLIATIITTQE